MSFLEALSGHHNAYRSSAFLRLRILFQILRLILGTAVTFLVLEVRTSRISIVDPLANTLGCFSQEYYCDKYK